MALEFAAFCQRNPKPCPLIGMGAPGDPSLPDLGDIDIRTDLPRYRVFKDGKLVEEPTDIRKYWTDDLVTFGKYRGRPESEMLADHDYCAWLSREPGVRALIANAPSSTAVIGVDEALDALAAAGIIFRRVPSAGAHDVALVGGKPVMLSALHKREQRGK